MLNMAEKLGLLRFTSIVSDLDGLLIDSEQESGHCWMEAFKRVGRVLTPDLYLATVGKGRKHMCDYLRQKLGDELPVEELSRLRDEIGHERMERLGLAQKPGALELIETIRSLKIPFALATSTKREEVARRLKAAKLSFSMFDASVCGDEVAKTKPAPDIYIAALHKLNVPAASSLAIEDSPTGAISALSAGLQLAVVPDLVAPTEEVIQQALVISNNLHDLLVALQNT